MFFNHWVGDGPYPTLYFNLRNNTMKDMILKTIKGVYNCYTDNPFEYYVWMSDVIQPLHKVDLLPNQRLRNVLMIFRLPPETLERLMGMEADYIRNIVNEDCVFNLEDQELISEWFGFESNIFQMDVVDIQTTISSWASDLQ